MRLGRAADTAKSRLENGPEIEARPLQPTPICTEFTPPRDYGLAFPASLMSLKLWCLLYPLNGFHLLEAC